MSKIYTGIGSRETPEEVLKDMKKLGYILAENGWSLRSGHAPGADQAFEEGALLSGKSGMEIYLPWDGFERAPRYDRRYFVPFEREDLYKEAERVAAQFHPAWGRCSSGARKMHTRNVAQVSGPEMQQASQFVICWTLNGRRGGGTGQALRIANYLHIPIFDLALVKPQEILNYISTHNLH